MGEAVHGSEPVPERLRAASGRSTVEDMTAAPLTEGDVDRGQVPDHLRRLRAVVALAPHLPGSDPMRDAVVDWVSTHLDEDAAALFVTHLIRARELRAEGGLSDAHTRSPGWWPVTVPGAWTSTCCPPRMRWPCWGR